MAFLADATTQAEQTADPAWLRTQQDGGEVIRETPSGRVALFP
ncbi:hypothetical protein [Streptomyces sp. NPDC006368]